MTEVADALNDKYGQGTVELTLTDSYYNMKEIIEKHMHLIDYAKAVMSDLGMKADIIPVRGGTDGCRLSYMGLPCPNLEPAVMPIMVFWNILQKKVWKRPVQLLWD